MTMSMYKRRGARNLVAAILALGFMQAPVAFAATQGELGQTSTGTVDVHLKTNYLLKISGLKDINLNWDGAKLVSGELSENALTGKIDFCVFTNQKSSGDKYLYTMAVSSGNSENPFELKSDSFAETVSYKVYIGGNGVTSQSSANGTWGEGETGSGLPVGGFVGSNDSNLIQCASGSENTRMWVVADQKDAIAVEPGSYKDTLDPGRFQRIKSFKKPYKIFFIRMVLSAVFRMMRREILVTYV